MSVQAFRIYGIVADFDVNPGPKAFWSSLVRKAFHRLSFWKCCKPYQNWIFLAILWKDFDTIMVLDQISKSHLFQKKNGFTITWIEIVVRHRATSIFNSIRLLILIFPMAFAILLLVWWLMHLSFWGNYFVHRSFFFFIFCHEKHDWWSPLNVKQQYLKQAGLLMAIIQRHRKINRNDGNTNN